MQKTFTMIAAILAILTIANIFCTNADSTAIKMLSSKPNNLPKRIAIKGNVVDVAHFRDRDGEHFTIISEYVKGQYFKNGYISEISAADYLVKDTGFQQQWKIWDQSGVIYGTIGYVKGTLRIFDFDNNGKAETRFLYQTVYEGADPSTVKYMLFYNNQKFPIRGTIPVEDDAEAFTKSIDAIYNTKQDLKKFASKEWDSLTVQLK